MGNLNKLLNCYAVLSNADGSQNTRKDTSDELTSSENTEFLEIDLQVNVQSATYEEEEGDSTIVRIQRKEIY